MFASYESERMKARNGRSCCNSIESFTSFSKRWVIFPEKQVLVRQPAAPLLRWKCSQLLLTPPRSPAYD
ncbi:hypothetical protein [Paraburkholderia azotifigens]|uniref:hypothetical protein n=1 Tax=Paraburkholderia azotifigens TaxID=2057004 RepID=UPI0038BBAC5B